MILSAHKFGIMNRKSISIYVMKMMIEDSGEGTDSSLGLHPSDVCLSRAYVTSSFYHHYHMYILIIFVVCTELRLSTQRGEQE